LVAHGKRLAAFSLLLVLASAPARAADCTALLLSRSPIVLRASFVAVWPIGWRPSVIAGQLEFQIDRGDPVEVLRMIGVEREPKIRTWLNGVLPTREMDPQSRRVTDYEYVSLEGDIVPGAAVHYKRTVKQDGVPKATETGTVLVGERSTLSIGDCAVDVIALDESTSSSLGWRRAEHKLYAPQLGYFVDVARAQGSFAIIYSATSLEAAP
jgi:hypothetical protein